MKYTNNFTEFKVKRRWWTIALFLFFQIFALACIVGRVYLMAAIILAADFFIIPDALHYRYIINDKFIIVKRILYPDTEIPLSTITQINNYMLMMNKGFALKIIETIHGGYKINYSIFRGKNEVVIISPKDCDKFIRELCSRVDKEVNLIHNTESAFKKRKDLI